MMTRLFLVAALFASLLWAARGNPADAVPPSPSPPGTSTTVTPSGGRSPYSYVHVDGPYVAITFDDGPHAKNTPRLLDLLAAKHIKATFCLIGERAADYPAIVKRIADEGHEIANHT